MALQVVPGREFMDDVTKGMAKHDARIRRGNVKVHRDQGIVERFDRNSGERLFISNEFFNRRNQSWRIEDTDDKKIVNVANPIENEDAANKKYVDNKK